MHCPRRGCLTGQPFLRPCGVRGTGYPVKLWRRGNSKTSVFGFSVSPALAREFERLAECEGMTKSDLFRRMVTTYKAEREEAEFVALQRKMARRACKTGVFTEEKVERIMVEDR
jgi:hypothetical protein